MNLLKRLSENKFFLMGIIIIISLQFIYLDFSSKGKQDTLGYKLLSIKIGDRCIVCDLPIREGSGLALLIKGRRVTIDLEHFQEFIENKAKYFANLEPHGALFQESAVLPKTMRYGWFIAGLWIFSALIAAAVCCSVAIKKGLRAHAWFFRGLLLHLFGVIWIMMTKATLQTDKIAGFRKIPVTSEPVPCPKCGALNHPAANQCSNCLSKLIPTQESEVSRI